jgi:hypothetical protein
MEHVLEMTIKILVRQGEMQPARLDINNKLKEKRTARCEKIPEIARL